MSDFIKVLNLAEKSSAPYAIVADAAVTRPVKQLCELLGLDRPIFETAHFEDSVARLRLLQEAGYQLILGDAETVASAAAFSFSTLQFLPGSECISRAFDMAVKFAHSVEEAQYQNALAQAMLENAGLYSVLYADGHIAASSLPENTASQKMLDYLERKLPSVITGEDPYFEYFWQSKRLCGQSKKVTLQGREAWAFYITVMDEGFQSEEFIRIHFRRSNAKVTFESIFSESSYIGGVRRLIDEFSDSSAPVLILGESGAGKNYVAEYLFEKNKNYGSSMIIIDCKMIPKNKWKQLIRKPSSPFHRSGTCIYVKNIEKLQDDQVRNLIALIDQSNLCKRNRMIFSMNIDGGTQNNGFYSYMQNRPFVLILQLPSLRSRIHEIPTLASLYLSQISVLQGKRIIGFEPEALSLLQSFDWPHNIEQLRRILQELVTISDNTYITAREVQLILEKEQMQAYQPYVSIRKETTAVDLNKTLEQITADVARAALALENNNHTKAAKRLGISRTTLWRILQS